MNWNTLFVAIRKRESFIKVKSRANVSKPTGGQHEFAHFDKDPNSDVCRMTNTTRARCKRTLLNHVRGIPPRAALREQVTADHKRKMSQGPIIETISSYKYYSRM